ncbi:MAG TPA: DUF6513 domain-containing protein [Planctomycetaceae bacterium]
MTDSPASRERILFVTGRLAEPAVREVVSSLGRRLGFEFEVAVLGVGVAALLTPGLVARKLNVAGRFDRAVLPGWCLGDLAPLAERFGFPFERGPKDIYDLPAHFGSAGRESPDLSAYDIEILAEINHAPRLTETELLCAADAYRADGADVIDLGCEPGRAWDGVAGAVAALRREGHRVSIDSFERAEVETAVVAGAELVLSCNSTNVDWACRLPAELVAIPDDPKNLDSISGTVERLREAGARFRIDPILEPIGFGFAESLARYRDARRRWPDVEMMMGVGNLTELTEVDSAGVNALLAGVCQELRVRSVLTTQVINWCRSAVKELDLARRLMRYAVTRGVPPKRLDSSLLLLRDPSVPERGAEELARLRAAIRDPNFRLFAEGGELHMMNRDGHWHGRDPYEVFDRALEASGPIDPQHAFYLGYELAKAATALTLGKRYVQDEALRWGFLTRPETSAVERRRDHRATGDAGA